MGCRPVLAPPLLSFQHLVMADRIEREQVQERVQMLVAEGAPVTLVEHMAFELAVKLAVELLAVELLVKLLVELLAEQMLAFAVDTSID